MLCKYCGKEMELGCNKSVNINAKSLYFCECGAECITYENGKEDWWEKDEIDIKKNKLGGEIMSPGSKRGLYKFIFIAVLWCIDWLIKKNK